MLSQRLVFVLVLSLGLFSLNPASATEAVQVDYMLNCQGCHLPDGSGFPLRNVPTMKNELGKFLHVDGGRQFLIQVPGSAQSDLPDKQLARLINWMLTTFSPNELPKDFQPYTADEIHKLRQSPLINVTEVRKQLIEKIQKLAAES